jgi:pantoate--beta-alanine ligase
VKVARTIPAIRRLLEGDAAPIVLVPTMGALHAGHTALIDRARKLAGPKGRVVVSIFVNPTQFGPREDLSRYPRPFAKDRRLCAEHGADFIFHPTPEVIYPESFSTYVEETEVSGPLCGTSRPGHFRGVTTVVLKLFTIIEPDIAVFGLKDYQQCAVIRRMVRDLNLRVRINAAPTVRESDGLALSSRNAYLSAEERTQAPVIRRALMGAQRRFQDGEKSAAKLRQFVAREIARSPLARVDYIDLVGRDSLKSLRTVDQPAVIATAVFFGTTRLIDNIIL